MNPGAGPGHAGRPREPRDDEVVRVWKAWEALGRTPEKAEPADWVTVADEAGVSLRIVWQVAKRWYDWSDGQHSTATAG